MNELIVFQGILQTAQEVFFALLPMILLVPIMQFAFRPPKSTTLNIIKGLTLTFVGVTLLLHGVHIGFIGPGRSIGAAIGSLKYKWLAIPIGAFIGFVAVIAEPAVQVLCDQVDEASSGTVTRRPLLLTLAGSSALLVGLGMARLVYGIRFTWIIYAGYFIALVLLQFADPVFSAIAFDSGGVATGPMVATLVLSVGIGLAQATEGRDTVLDGFGLVAMVALAPILSIMVLGQVYKRKDDVDASDSTRSDSSDSQEGI
ncbi:MAG: DUF1538 domain-containing protein [Firmicutes bacterium]|nr:DUF1538 domain-containing protein [Bacillota bacterium]